MIATTFKDIDKYAKLDSPALTGNMTINGKTPESFKTHYSGDQSDIGYLIKICKATDDRMISIHMWGNSYSHGMPIDTYIQSYNYATGYGIINCKQINNGYNVLPTRFFRLDGFTFAWVPTDTSTTAHFSVSSQRFAHYSMDFELSCVPMPTVGVTNLVTCKTVNRTNSETFDLTLLNGWVDNGGHTSAVKTGDWCNLSLQIRHGVSKKGTDVTILPEACRPTYHFVMWTTMGYEKQIKAPLVVAPSGRIYFDYDVTTPDNWNNIYMSSGFPLK